MFAFYSNIIPEQSQIHMWFKKKQVCACVFFVCVRAKNFCNYFKLVENYCILLITDTHFDKLFA